MKKYLTLILTAFMVLTLPSAIFAEEQEVSTNQTTVELIANKASAYTVKLPKTFDVSNNSSEFKVFAKGDISADESLVIAVGDGQHVLKDVVEASSKQYELTVTVDDGTITFENLPLTNYSQDVFATFTITHDSLLAGSYSYVLPVVISIVK